MPYPFTVDDVAWLASPAGREAVVEAATLDLADPLRAATALRHRFGDRGASVLETALLQHRAAGRVPVSWLLTADALEQATTVPVAAHRAARLAALGVEAVHDVTCSVGAELDALRSRMARLVGSDLDPVRLAMARVNVPGVTLVRADALAPVTRGAVIVADPGRRTVGGRRVFRAADCTPPLDALAEAAGGPAGVLPSMDAGCQRSGSPDAQRPKSHSLDRELVVSTAPGLDPAQAPWAAEVELVSLDGRVRETALWSAGLATARRRATVLSTSSPPWQLTDADDDTCDVREPGEWLVDPDGAVVRAGLVRQFAARHGLGQLDPRIAYLTGDAPPPGIRSFRILADGPYKEKTLRAELRRRGIGRLEILVRGLGIDPNTLRPRLRLVGAEEATLVLTRIGRGARAFICAPRT